MSLGIKIRGKRENARQKLLPATGSRQLKVQLAVEVKFGVPSKKCDNYGICQINRTDDVVAAAVELPECLNCGKAAKAIMSLYSGNRIELLFPKSSLLPKVRAAVFGSLRFEVEEDYLLPDSVFDPALSPDEEWTFKSGRYFILETDGFYFINFQ
ncbi:MAG TPA: hypothetical protein PKE06_15765 [Flavilitoribacter sp.]|nr:hypothetical protein [Flavilitoribacter sp.]HMQ86603.1 hypothetical protein [Flavilitoribacter sp.]